MVNLLKRIYNRIFHTVPPGTHIENILRDNMHFHNKLHKDVYWNTMIDNYVWSELLTEVEAHTMAAVRGTRINLRNEFNV